MRSLSAVCAALVGAAACSSGGPAAIGAQPSWRKPRVVEASRQTTAGPLELAPRTPAVGEYNEAHVAPPAASAIGDAVTASVAHVAATLGMSAPVPDARLSAAADELAAVVPDEGVVPYELVEFAIQRHGIIEPSPHLLVVWGPLDDAKPIVEQLEPRVPELLRAGADARVGIGVATRQPDGEGVVILALQGSALDTKPIPRALPGGGTIRVQGSLHDPFKNPEVFVTREDGGVSEPAALVTGNGFDASIDCPATPGRLQLEIVGYDANGSTVLANFPVWCREEPPASLKVTPADDGGATATSTEAEAERAVFALVNRDRVKAGLPALAWDDGVAAVARAHSQEMRKTGVVAHVSATTGSAADRVKAAGIRTGVVLENIARAYAVGEAHQGLMNSPGHRANLLSPMATHLGVGIAYGDEISGQREMFVTEVFIRIPPTIDPPAARAQIRAKLDGVRRTSDDAALAGVAQSLADDLAHGTPLDQARATATGKLQPLARRFARVGSVVTAVADLDAVDGAALLGDGHATIVGIGVAQGPHPDLGDKAIWIVLIVAEPAAGSGPPSPPLVNP
jgi:uncharacterized protein YkwD